MPVLYEKSGKIATITIDRPKAFNTINPETFKELSDAFIKFKEDDEAWVAILTGSGNKAFCAGADIKEMLPALADISYVDPPSITRDLEIWKPIIVAINGICLGGGAEIAMACDIRIASENASFGQPEVKWGLIPGWGGTQRLPRFVGRAKAAELLLMGNTIDANEAYRIGLINKVVPLDELMSTANEWAEKICENGPLAVRAAKESMIRGYNMGLAEGLHLEKHIFNGLQRTEDLSEGTSAFAEKRKPQYKAR